MRNNVIVIKPHPVTYCLLQHDKMCIGLHTQAYRWDKREMWTIPNNWSNELRIYRALDRCHTCDFVARLWRATLTRDSDAPQSRSVRLHSRTLRLWRNVRQTNFLRMDDDSFSILLQRIAPTIQRQDTVLRKVIQAEERLSLTLRYLATGTQLINMVTSLTT